MALIICEECGKEISSKAVSCPNCGCPTVETKESDEKTDNKNDYNEKNINVVLIILTILSIPFSIIVFISLIYSAIELSNKKRKNKVNPFCMFVFTWIIMVGHFVNWIDNQPVTSEVNQNSNIVESLENDNNKYVTTIWDASGKRDIYYNDFSLIENETIGKNKKGTYIIQGKVKQNIEGSFNSLMISFIMYDSNHKKVRKTSGIIISNYEGNGIWSFEVSGNDADNIVASYELEYCYGTNI